jgi:hypothetical protein
LQLERLMVDVVASIRHDWISVKSAVLLIETRILLIVASTRNWNTSETLRHLQLLLMAAVFALDCNLGGSNGCPAGIGNDTWDDNHLSNEVALKVSQHAGNFVAVNLHLEQRNRISLLKILGEIVSFIHLLHCFFKLNFRFCNVTLIFLQLASTLPGMCGDSKTAAHRSCLSHPYQPWGSMNPCWHCSGVVLYKS